MPPIILKRSEFRAILKQAQREESAFRAGYDSHTEMVQAHRAARVAKMREKREARKAAHRTARDRVSSFFGKKSE